MCRAYGSGRFPPHQGRPPPGGLPQSSPQRMFPPAWLIGNLISSLSEILKVEVPKTMIHALLVLAAILFVLWLLFHASGAIVNLLWIAIIVAVVLWLLGFLRRGSAV